ncbi:uncharacterized protein LOC127702437 [Mytilus californianus]|uniref:uncharacterized protein LOC127702437 n=1 Tax=Mytilus californianus TaxID=6549 RepID=UPI0022473E84|nr:uncharacterized protein LOC127702437 [Mytilus californianus]
MYCSTNTDRKCHAITMHETQNFAVAKQRQEIGITARVLDMTLAKCLLIRFCTDVFWDCCLTQPSLSFEEFLNTNKHDIYHLVFGYNNFCCQCHCGYTFPVEQLTQSNFTHLFGKTAQLCSSCVSSSTRSTICAVEATNGISVRNIDDLVADILLPNICPLKKAVSILVKIRNKMYGHVAEAKMTNQDYKIYMLETEKSLIQIAAMCQKETEARQTIEDLRQRPLDETLLIKYQTVLLRDIQAEKEISETQREIKEYLETNLGSVQERLASIELLQTTKMQDVLSAMDEIGKQKTKDTGRRTEKYDEISRLTDAAVKVHLEEGTFVQTSAMPAILKSL